MTDTAQKKPASADAAPARPSTIVVWIAAVRPKTLPASVAPVLVGTAVAIGQGNAHGLTAIAALWGAMWIQIGTNLANDYYDAKRGADSETRIGPTRVVQAGWLTPRQVLGGFWASYAMALIAGAYLIWVGGLPIAIVGVASLVAGWAYTGGPYPLGYHGLGEVFVFVFFGPVAVIGTVFVQMQAATPVNAWEFEFEFLQSPSWAAILASLPIGLLTMAILVVNNFRDIDTDRDAGKRTLTVRVGRSATRVLFAGMLAVALLATVAMFIIVRTREASQINWVFALPLLSTLFAIPVLRAVMTKTDGPSLNKALAGTARLLLIYAALLSLALIAPAVFGW